MQCLFLLGRQPALGLAELESLYGGASITPIGAPVTAALVDIDSKRVDFDRLGGSVKFAVVLATLPGTDWRSIEQYLIKAAATIGATTPEGKIQLGLSAYGLRISTSQLLATGLTLKKALKSVGRSVRLIPNKDIELNSASVLHNHLTGDTGCEFIIFRSGSVTIIARTLHVQDIEAYTVRDRERPKRDARIGMLPPKLAQIIINLAAGLTKPLDRAGTILDPFCGTGVVLQEALLMGYGAYGSDLEPRMIEYTDLNLEWLTANFASKPPITTEIADATSHTWGPIYSSLACETYLGRPFTSSPDAEILAQTISECNLIISKFLRNLRPQLPAGFRLCVAIPSWNSGNGEFKRLPLIDSLAELGYNHISFKHARTNDLIYHRADQIVARELLVLQKLAN